MMRPKKLDFVKRRTGPGKVAATILGHIIMQPNSDFWYAYWTNGADIVDNATTEEEAIKASQTAYDAAWLAGGEEEEYITDAKKADGNASYIVFAIGQKPDGETYVYNPQAMSGWQFKQLRPGCYAAIPLPDWQPLPTPPNAKGGA